MARLPLLAAIAALAVAGIWLALGSAGVSPVAATSCAPARAHTSGTFERTLATNDGRLRLYRLHVPPSYTGSDAVPLVLNFHGFTSNSVFQESYTDFSTRADQPDGGFIVVYPQGTTPVTNSQWNNTQNPGLADDLAFVNELLDDLQANLCLDASQVFSTGLSNGGFMSSRLACSLSSRIAAFAPVAGAYYPPISTSNPSETCPDTRAVPMIAFHGTSDTVVPFNGGSGILGGSFRLPQDNTTADEDVLEDWAIHNGCTGGRQEVTLFPDVRLVTYDTCTDGATVQLYIIDGGGHTWPDAFDIPILGVTTHNINATDLAWAFFQAHPLPGGKPTPPPAKDVASDADGDGCTSAQELGPTLSLGGLRHPKIFWDFFDVPTPPTFARDEAVAVNDIAAVLARFGSSGLTTIDPLSTPAAAPAYHTAYDRGPGPVIGTTSAPNGAVSIQDVSLSVQQFGHNCL